MTLTPAEHKWQLDLFNKYSFIDRTEVKSGHLFFYYTVDGKPMSKRITARASIQRVQNLILDIRKEVGVTPYGLADKSIYIV